MNRVSHQGLPPATEGDRRVLSVLGHLGAHAVAVVIADGLINILAAMTIREASSQDGLITWSWLLYAPTFVVVLLPALVVLVVARRAQVPGAWVGLLTVVTASALAALMRVSFPSSLVFAIAYAGICLALVGRRWRRQSP